MCGIGGITSEDGAAAVRRMTAALAHRGPDGGDAAPLRGKSGVVGWFGHRRLAIIDLSDAGRQPMSTPDGRFWITYNGEIFNFREIRRRLEGEGASFVSQTDTEVILEAYKSWGAECLKEFRGMFAFAIWDSVQERLFIARDRLGIKPLYYHYSGGRLCFASELRALLQSGLVPRTLNRAGVADFLRFGSIYEPGTIIEGVHALRPGHYMTWEGGRVRETEYWEVGRQDFSPGPAPAAELLGSIGPGGSRALNRIRELLTEAVLLRLVSDVPLGVFLSGGIDSSALVGLISQSATADVNTFSLIFQEEEYNEARYSRLVARRFRTSHCETLISQDEALAAIPDALAAMDQPSIDGVNTYIVSREARAAGLKVVLSGLGGDEVFAGYDTFRTVANMRRVASAWESLPVGARGFLAAPITRALPNNDRGNKLACLFRPDAKGMDPYVLARTLFTPAQAGRLMKSNGFRDDGDSGPELSERLRRAGCYDAINRVSYLELRTYMLNTLLRDTDAMSMAHGLEVRVPLLDHKLVEAIFSVPGGDKVKRHTPKYLLSKAVEDLLPREVVHRRKRGFTLPFEHWFRGGMRGEMERYLTGGKRHLVGEFLNPSAMGDVWLNFLANRVSWSRPWSLYVLGRWCEMNLG